MPSSPSEAFLEKGPLDAAHSESAVVKILRLLLRCLRVFSVFKPSILCKSSGSTTKLRRTAYLDGIRGFAALLVYILHHTLWAHEAQFADKKLENAWGYEGHYYLAAFHGIRTFFTGGHYAVANFFVLSAYCLSLKPMSLIHAGDYEKLGDSLSSSLFRRWFRLYLPIICVTLFLVFLWHVGGLLANFFPQKSLRDELWTWYLEFKGYTWVFNTSPAPWLSYNPHSWSIPIEFKGSIAVFTSLMAFSRCTRTARLWCEVGIVFYFMWIVDGAYYALFSGGVLLCDLDMLAAKDELPLWFPRPKAYAQIMWHCLLVISVLLGGVPSYDRDMDVLRRSPGWYWLSFLKPQAVFDYKWFYLFWAAMILVAAVPRIPWLRGFFESRFCQYLGRISYMFYLVHGPVLWTLGDRIYAAVGMWREGQALGLPGWANKFPLPRVGPFGMEISFILPHLILLPFTLWIAEVATTVIDTPSNNFCAWLYKKTQPSENRPLLRQVELIGK